MAVVIVVVAAPSWRSRVPVTGSMAVVIGHV